MKRLGHRNIRTTIDIYGHLTKHADRDLADELSAMYEREYDDATSNVVPITAASSAS